VLHARVAVIHPQTLTPGRLPYTTELGKIQVICPGKLLNGVAVVYPQTLTPGRLPYVAVLDKIRENCPPQKFGIFDLEVSIF
jgi:hypothetical protein